MRKIAPIVDRHSRPLNAGVRFALAKSLSQSTTQLPRPSQMMAEELKRSHALNHVRAVKKLDLGPVTDAHLAVELTYIGAFKGHPLIVVELILPPAHGPLAIDGKSTTNRPGCRGGAKNGRPEIVHSQAPKCEAPPPQERRPVRGDPGPGAPTHRGRT